MPTYAPPERPGRLNPLSLTAAKLRHARKLKLPMNSPSGASSDPLAATSRQQNKNQS